MVIVVEVKDTFGKLIERRSFSIYDVAISWFDRARDLYGKGVSISFGPEHAVLR